MSVIPPPVDRVDFKIQYFIDSVDFITHGIYVRESAGLFDRPKRKIVYKHNWDEVDGEEVDLSNFVVEAREFRLECFVKGETIQDARDKINAFFTILDSAESKPFDVHYYGPLNKLSFYVYREEAVRVIKKFRFLQNVWTFTLVLKEHVK